MKNRTFHFTKKIDALYLAQQGRCFHCLEKMSICVYRRRSHPTGWTREHVVPLSKGGNKGLSNVVLAHRKCNFNRGTLDFDEIDKRRFRVIRAAANLAFHTGWRAA